MATSSRGMFNLVHLFFQFLTLHNRSLQRVQECQVTVDLDAEENRKPGKEPNTFRIVIRPTKTVNLVTIDAFLKGRADFSNDTLEALSKCHTCDIILDFRSLTHHRFPRSPVARIS